jgi:hypothetical protein
LLRRCSVSPPVNSTGIQCQPEFGSNRGGLFCLLRVFSCKSHERRNSKSSATARGSFIESIMAPVAAMSFLPGSRSRTLGAHLRGGWRRPRCETQYPIQITSTPFACLAQFGSKEGVLDNQHRAVGPPPLGRDPLLGLLHGIEIYAHIGLGKRPRRSRSRVAGTRTSRA